MKPARVIILSVALLAAGAAAFLAMKLTGREPVVVLDLEGSDTSPWRPLIQHGIRAVWSTPLIAADGALLGAIDLYSREARGPAEADLALAESAGHVAEMEQHGIAPVPLEGEPVCHFAKRQDVVVWKPERV